MRLKMDAMPNEAQFIGCSLLVKNEQHSAELAMFQWQKVQIICSGHKINKIHNRLLLRWTPWRWSEVCMQLNLMESTWMRKEIAT